MTIDDRKKKPFTYVISHSYLWQRKRLLLRSALPNRCARFSVLNRQKCLMRRKERINFGH